MMTESEIAEYLDKEQSKRVRVGWELLYRDGLNLVIAKDRYYDMTRHREIWYYEYGSPEDQMVINKAIFSGETFLQCRRASRSYETAAREGRLHVCMPEESRPPSFTISRN